MEDRPVKPAMSGLAHPVLGRSARTNTCLAASLLFVMTTLDTGCTVSAGPPPPSSSAGPPPPPPGAVIIDWTIDGTKDPAHCQISGAADLHVALHSAAGGFTGDFVQDCTVFATTVSGLFPDEYGGQADLLDGAGRPRTTSVDLAPFEVIGNTTVTVLVDFPASSFF
jgi:hypothetical protein